jgi:hypothetical protein
MLAAAFLITTPTPRSTPARNSIGGKYASPRQQRQRAKIVACRQVLQCLNPLPKTAPVAVQGMQCCATQTFGMLTQAGEYLCPDQIARGNGVRFRQTHQIACDALN